MLLGTNILKKTTKGVRPADILAELCADNQHLTRSLRSAHEICEKLDDVATASLIENWIHETERRTWFLSETVYHLVFFNRPDSSEKEKQSYPGRIHYVRRLSDMRDQARRGPFEPLRSNLMVGSAARSRFRIADEVTAYRLICTCMFWTV